MNRMRAERELLRELNEGSDSVTGAMPAVDSDQTTFSRSAGNPNFKAQFDLDMALLYFTEAAGVYTSILPAALNATLQTRLAAFIFANTDFASGFATLKRNLPLSVWQYGRPLIVGKDQLVVNGVDLDATATAGLVDGDLIIPAFATVAATNYVGLVRIRCNQVEYGTLLESIGSDTFRTNMIRYIVDTTLTKQFANPIEIYTISLFGKFSNDSVNPNSFKLPEQFQNGIIDVPLKKGFTKHQGLGTYIDYDVTAFSWQIFVPVFNRLGMV